MSFPKLPSLFIENRGQVNSRVDYYVPGTNTSVYFSPSGLTLALREEKLDAPGSPGRGSPVPNPRTDDPTGWAVKLDFVGANPRARPAGEDPTAAMVNYLVGAPAQWRTAIPTYRRLVYRDLWPGIDVAYEASGNRLKYSFLVAPGADPDRIHLAIRGASGLTLGPAGELRIPTPLGVLSDTAPVSYQRTGGRRVIVPTTYHVGPGGYGFEVGRYDSALPLLIDPELLVYSTFLGGGFSESATAIGVDDAGAAYVTGYTSSVDFPVTPGAFDPTFDGGRDPFVSKLSRDGSSLVYSTFLGGSADDWAWDLAVDGAGAAYVTGEAVSEDFPTTPGAYDSTLGGFSDAFVTKLAPDGASLTYSTFLGGGTSDHGYGIVVDGSGNAILTGGTFSPSFPTTPGAFDRTFNGDSDVFVATLAPDGASLVYSTFLGGLKDDSGEDIAVDGTGGMYVGGATRSADFPSTPGAFDPTYSERQEDAFITKVAPDGRSLSYSSFLGNNGPQFALSVAVDGAGAAYVTGFTEGPDFPRTPGAFDPTFNGGITDAFVTKLAPDGVSLAYSTFLGGGGDEYGYGIEVDASGRAYIAGPTESGAFPTTIGAFDPTYNGGISDGFATLLAPDGASLVSSTFIGGTSDDRVWGLAVEPGRFMYVSGFTQSKDFPITPGAFDPLYEVQEAFVAKLGLSAPRCTISGSSGDDRIQGTEEEDVICAKAGADSVSGKGGDDFVLGQRGDDTLVGGSGSDVVSCRLAGARPTARDGQQGPGTGRRNPPDRARGRR